MDNSLKSRFAAISQKVIAVNEIEEKIVLFKEKLALPEKAMLVCNSALKTVTVGFGEIAKDIFGLPTNTGAFEDAQENFYITSDQFKRVYLSSVFNEKLSEGLLSIAEQCEDHSAKIKTGQLKKFSF